MDSPNSILKELPLSSNAVLVPVFTVRFRIPPRIIVRESESENVGLTSVDACEDQNSVPSTPLLFSHSFCRNSSGVDGVRRIEQIIMNNISSSYRFSDCGEQCFAVDRQLKMPDPRSDGWNAARQS